MILFISISGCRLKTVLRERVVSRRVRRLAGRGSRRAGRVPGQEAARHPAHGACLAGTPWTSSGRPGGARWCAASSTRSRAAAPAARARPGPSRCTRTTRSGTAGHGAGHGTLPGRDSTDAQFSIRYVGDMLAWLHQATASEKEHLEALLKQVTAQGGCPAGVWRLSRGPTPTPCSPQRRACHLRGAGQPGRPPLRAPRPAADALCPRHLHPVTQLLTPFPWAPRPSASSLGAFAFRARLGALARAVSGHPGLSTRRAKAV